MEVDNDYKERYAKILEEYDPENVSETAFTFNGWQFLIGGIKKLISKFREIIRTNCK